MKHEINELSGNGENVMARVTIKIRGRTALWVKVWDRSTENYVKEVKLEESDDDVECDDEDAKCVEVPNITVTYQDEKKKNFGEVNFDVSKDDKEYTRMETKLVEDGESYWVKLP